MINLAPPVLAAGALRRLGLPVVIVVILLIFWGQAIPGQAQGNGQLKITKSVSQTEVPTGQEFTYTLRYRCASITTDCHEVIVTDVLPPELSANAADVIMTGSLVHTTNQV